MDGETFAYIAFVLTGAIFWADLVFNFLSKEWSTLLIIVWCIAVLYLVVNSLVKRAVKKALEEHHEHN